jgi:purine-binding chemotaxis protein CheW
MSSDRGRADAEVVHVVGKDGSLFAFADALMSAVQQAQINVSNEIRQFVTFYLRDQEYAIPILQCCEILRCPTITRIPEAPIHVRGVVNTRGHIIPVVETRRCFGLEPTSPTSRSRLIVVEVTGRRLALLVDRVTRILKLAATAIEPAVEAMENQGVIGQARLADGLVLLIDAERMLRAGSVAGDPTTRGEKA